MSTTATIIGLMLLFVFCGWFCILLYMVRDGVKNLYHAPAWQVRCPDCGRSEEAARYDIYNYMNKGWPKQRKWIVCDCCRKPRNFFVEPVPAIDGKIPRNQYYPDFVNGRIVRINGTDEK
jgi:hypothetical protein